MKRFAFIAILSGILFTGCKKETSIDTLNSKNEGNPEYFTQKTGLGTYYLNEVNNLCKTPKKFDIYCPNSTTPTPLIIAFHGGSFTEGDRSLMYPYNFNAQRYNFQWITETNLDNRNIAYAAVDYSLAKHSNTNNIMDALNDCKSYVDYFQANAAQYNIDPNNIVLMGHSAGASAALWIGLQNIYPSIKGMVCFDPQASLDLSKWRTTIFGSYSELQEYCDEMLNDSDIVDLSNLLYRGTITPSELSSLHLKGLVDPSDPEVYLVSYNPYYPHTDLNGDFLHHDYHIHSLIARSIHIHHDKMKFMYDIANNYWGYKHPTPETIINFCDRVCN